MKIINTFVFKIMGIQNPDHARDITFALDEAGFGYAVVDRDARELIIPHSYLGFIDRIKLIIESVGGYNLIV
jgi:hypothetical protein